MKLISPVQSIPGGDPVKQAESSRFAVQPIPALVLSMSAPIMFSLLIQALYNIVDSICVSSYSQYGLPALSLAFPLQLILTAVGNGTGVGAGILISRSWGKQEFSRCPPSPPAPCSAPCWTGGSSACSCSPCSSFYYSSFLRRHR